MKKNGVNNIIRIPTSLQTKFFRYWLEFLSPFHSLSNRELEVAAAFLKKRYELSKYINDEEILNKVLMYTDTLQQIKAECNVSSAHFQVILGKLRKSNVFIGNAINPKFIPKNIEEGDNSFRLLLYFDFNEETVKQTL